MAHPGDRRTGGESIENGLVSREHLLADLPRRTLAITWLACTAAYVVIDHFLVLLIPAVVAARPSPDSSKGLLQTLVSAAVWITYFLVSKRVKATFVA
jgi:Protein of unknown function (DUF2569)